MYCVKMRSRPKKWAKRRPALAYGRLRLPLAHARGTAPVDDESGHPEGDDQQTAEFARHFDPLVFHLERLEQLTERDLADDIRSERERPCQSHDSDQGGKHPI